VGTPLPTAVVFAPAAPIVSNRTFILNNQGLPTRLIDVIQSYPVGTTISWCNTIIGNVVCDTIAPAFPTSVGTYPYLVRAYHSASSLYSDTVGFTVQLVNKADLMQVQQIIGAPILQENSTYNIPVTIQITNKTNQLIDSVLVTNQLRSIFPSIVDFNIVSVAVSGNLVRNLLYNGDTQSGITTVESKINGGETVTIQLVININPKGYVGSIPSITNVTAKTFAGTLSYDSSPNSNNNGTGSTSTILLPELAIKVPEVFTPNRDGLNDRFVIIKPYGVRIDLEVYNRWGTKVFTRNNYQNDWDGRGDNAFSGQDLVDGGYYYTIKALNNNGTTQILKGFIIIQR
jgi:gliding motility-associated-like protein